MQGMRTALMYPCPNSGQAAPAARPTLQALWDPAVAARLSGTGAQYSSSRRRFGVGSGVQLGGGSGGSRRGS